MLPTLEYIGDEVKYDTPSAKDIETKMILLGRESTFENKED